MPVYASEAVPLHLLVRLVEATQATGERFFQGLVKALSETLGVRRAQIVETDPDDPLRVRTVAIWDRGQQPNVDFIIAPPCLHVLQNQTIVVPRAVQIAYPDNASLAELHAEAYIGTPLISSDGVVMGYMALIHDRALDASRHHETVLQLFAGRAAAEVERRRAEMALRESEHRERERAAELEVLTRSLREQDARKDEFLAMLSHELRNPLAPIRSATDVMRLVAPDHEKLTWARQVVERQLAQMTRLVDDLLDVSRLTQGKIRIQREAVDLGRITARAIETVRPRLEARRHELRVDFPSGDVLLWADEARLTQVIANLLDNAIKYTQPSGLVHLTIDRAGRELVIRVRDNGAGIAPEMLPRIFDMFVQADASLARAAGGLGIGLTLVRRLVEMHGGQVTASSDGLGHGTEIEVRLPALPERFERPVAVAPIADTPTVAPVRRILVVDDNADEATALTEMLTCRGHVVETVYDGEAALRAVSVFRPDAVLLDIGLPTINGLEVARLLRSSPDNDEMIIVATTGYGRDEDRQHTREAGFDHHLVKPFEPDALTAILAGHQGTNRAGLADRRRMPPPVDGARASANP
jgi:signal transduction histidine kinase/ActR/RegA family two-component response regulator